MMESRTIEVNGITMRWETAGEGFPVVLIHGIPTSPALWRHVVPRLEGIRALAWEMVGYGASIPEGRGRDISVARQADHLAAWMREVGVEGAVAVGHDLGGGIAQIAAVRHPGLLSGVVLTNSIGYDSWPIPAVKAMRAMRAVVKRLPTAAFRPVFASFIRMAHDDQRVASQSIDVHWRHYAAHDGPADFIRQVRSLDVRDTLAVSDRLSTLDLPARIVWGEADRFQKVRYGERLARDLGTTLQRIPGGKHYTPEDHPEEIASAVNGLVGEIRAAGP